MKSLSASPVNERAGILDSLRGFALLGICLANARYFALYIFQKKENLAAWPTFKTDRWLDAFHHVAIDGKFYSLFSMLFGIGFALIFYKTPGKGLLIFYRRLAILALLGLAHSFLLWDGDILFFYAVVGALLPLFRNASTRTLLICSIVLILSPLLFDALKVLTGGSANMARPFLQRALTTDASNGITDNNVDRWLVDHHSYGDLRAWCHSGFWWGWALRVDSNRMQKVLGLFLLGLCIGRSHFYTQLEENRRLLRRVQAWGFAVGLPAGLGMVFAATHFKKLPAAEGLWETLAYALNVVPLALAYAATIALNHSKGVRFRILQPVGRMALTNYIAQSLFGVMLYFGIGAGYAPQSPTVFMPVAVAFFALQVFWSHYWMRYFQYGPLEWLWRQATYGRRLPLRALPQRA